LTNTTNQTAHGCRWAVPTLFLPLPDWLDAWNRPWSCRRDGPPRPLESTECCCDCPRWQTRAELDVTMSFAQLGL